MSSRARLTLGRVPPSSPARRAMDVGMDEAEPNLDFGLIDRVSLCFLLISRVSKVEHDGRPEPLWRPFDGHIVKGRGLHLGTGHMSRWIEAVANERSGEPRGRIEAERVDLDRGAQEPARVEAEDQLVEKVDEERLAVLGLEI